MDGVLNIRKEKGYTSFDVVAKLRGILQKSDIQGHLIRKQKVCFRSFSERQRSWLIF